MGGGLESLELIGVGPAKRLEIEFAPRLNLITGDNGLGKTFLLECAWWALSGSWADPDQQAYPRSDSLRPAIRYQISGSPEKTKTVEFDRKEQQWPVPFEKRPILPGTVIYSRVDGSAMIWDPAKHYWSAARERVRGEDASDAIRLTQNEIWDSKTVPTPSGRTISVCNGLIRDWVAWQYIPPTTTFETFTKVLEKLSPHPKEFMLVPSTPIKLPGDDKDIPRLKMPYDDVPVTLLSAGIKRILSLAYLLVWTWEAHKEASQKIGRTPENKIVLLIDEMEAHLHPQWQRVIVPALLEVIKVLEKRLEIQLIIATHSPLIMASVEPIFDEATDSLFTLDLINSELEINKILFAKHGSVNAWLMSDVFQLARPYSVEAERALTEAKNLQLSNHPDPEKVKSISEQLVEYLPSIDPFWPRWKFFAEKYGVDL